METNTLDKTLMEVIFQSNGLIVGESKLQFLDGEIGAWVGGHEDTNEFVRLLKEIEIGYPGNVPTKLIFKFFKEINDELIELDAIDLSKLPLELREIAGLIIE